MNCQQATELASRQNEKPLSFGQKINFKVHLLMCKHCRNFNKNVAQLSESMNRFLGGNNTHDKNDNNKK